MTTGVSWEISTRDGFVRKLFFFHWFINRVPPSMNTVANRQMIVMEMLFQMGICLPKSTSSEQKEFILRSSKSKNFNSNGDVGF